MSNLLFNSERHEYTADGRKIPSVTQILAAVGMYNFGDIDRRILDIAAQRGTIVHKIIELYEKGTLDAESIDSELQGYFDAYLSCSKAHNLDRLNEFEKIVYSEKFRYCGMLDACNNELKIVIDHKTTAVSSPVHGIQLSAYWLAEHPDYLHDKPELLACGYYHNDGTFDFVKYEYQPLVWLSCLAVYNWQYKNNILKG